MRGLAPISLKFGNFGENVPRRADLKNQHGEPALYGEPAPGVRIHMLIAKYIIYLQAVTVLLNIFIISSLSKYEY